MWVQGKTGEVITPHLQNSRPVEPMQREARFTETAKDSGQKITGKRDFANERNGVQLNSLSGRTQEKDFANLPELRFTDALNAVSQQKTLHTTKQKQKFTSSPNHSHREQQANKKKSLLKTSYYPLFSFGITYLFGTTIAGVICASFLHDNALYYTYYLENMISFLQSNYLLPLFLHNFLVAIAMMTGILLSGLSAIGSPALFLLIFLKGLGSGTLLLQLFTAYHWNAIPYYLINFGVSEAFLVTGMCLLSVTAAKSAGAILRNISHTNVKEQSNFIKKLGAQYIAIVVFMFFISFLSVFLAKYCMNTGFTGSVLT